MKKTRVVLSPEAEEVYSRLNQEATESKTEEKLLRGINKKIELIKNNPHYGEPISKKKIPKRIFQKVWCNKSILGTKRNSLDFINNYKIVYRFKSLIIKYDNNSKL